MSNSIKYQKESTIFTKASYDTHERINEKGIFFTTLFPFKVTYSMNERTFKEWVFDTINLERVCLRHLKIRRVWLRHLIIWSGVSSPPLYAEKIDNKDSTLFGSIMSKCFSYYFSSCTLLVFTLASSL